MNTIDFINKHPHYVMQYLQNAARGYDLIRDCINGENTSKLGLTLVERKFLDPKVQKENEEWGHYGGRIYKGENISLTHVSGYIYTVSSKIYSKDIEFKIEVSEKSVINALRYFYYEKAIDEEYRLHLEERAKKANEIYRRNVERYGITLDEKDLIEADDVRG